MILLYLEVSKKKSDDKKIIIITSEKWEMKRWNSGLKGKSKRKKKWNGVKN